MPKIEISDSPERYSPKHLKKSTKFYLLFAWLILMGILIFRCFHLFKSNPIILKQSSIQDIKYQLDVGTSNLNLELTSDREYVSHVCYVYNPNIFDNIEKSINDDDPRIHKYFLKTDINKIGKLKIESTEYLGIFSIACRGYTNFQNANTFTDLFFIDKKFEILPIKYYDDALQKYIVTNHKISIKIKLERELKPNVLVLLFNNKEFDPLNINYNNDKDLYLQFKNEHEKNIKENNFSNIYKGVHYRFIEKENIFSQIVNVNFKFLKSGKYSLKILLSNFNQDENDFFVDDFITNHLVNSFVNNIEINNSKSKGNEKLFKIKSQLLDTFDNKYFDNISKLFLLIDSLNEQEQINFLKNIIETNKNDNIEIDTHFLKKIRYFLDLKFNFNSELTNYILILNSLIEQKNEFIFKIIEFIRILAKSFTGIEQKFEKNFVDENKKFIENFISRMVGFLNENFDKGNDFFNQKFQNFMIIKYLYFNNIIEFLQLDQNESFVIKYIIENNNCSLAADQNLKILIENFQFDEILDIIS